HPRPRRGRAAVVGGGGPPPGPWGRSGARSVASVGPDPPAHPRLIAPRGTKESAARGGSTERPGPAGRSAKLLLGPRPHEYPLLRRFFPLGSEISPLRGSGYPLWAVEKNRKCCSRQVPAPARSAPQTRSLATTIHSVTVRAVSDPAGSPASRT